MYAVSFDRRPLRERIYTEIVGRIGIRRLRPNDDLNEAALAAELNVSRTPLREALITLTLDGVLESRAGRGFRVAPLSRKELEDILVTLGEVEALALARSSGPRLRSEHPRLVACAREGIGGELNLGALFLDAWSEALICPSDSTMLQRSIARLRTNARRYTFSAAGPDPLREAHRAQRLRICELFQKGDNHGAAKAVRSYRHECAAAVLNAASII